MTAVTVDPTHRRALDALARITPPATDTTTVHVIRKLDTKEQP